MNAIPAPAAPEATSPVAALVSDLEDLVPLPQAYIRIRELVDDPAAGLNDIAAIVQTDPALTARLLRLVNSAFVGLMEPIESVDHAVRVLGMDEVHDMALATSAIGSLSRLRGDLIDIHAFWRLSVYCAGAAREVAAGVDWPSPQRLFVCGLLHNIGSLIIAHEMPESYAASCAQARAEERSYAEVQRDLFGFDYAAVGEAMLEQWHLPESLSQPVGQHTHAIDSLPGAQQPLAAIMSVAATTARAANWQSSDSEPVPEYDPVALALTGIDADGMEALMSRVDSAVADSLAALVPDYR